MSKWCFLFALWQVVLLLTAVYTKSNTVHFSSLKRPWTWFFHSNLMELPSRSNSLVVVESLLSGGLLVSSFIGNILVILIVFKKPRLGTSTNIYIASLATTDFLNACISGPLFLASLITGRMPFSSPICNLGGFFMHFLTLVSMPTMALIAINRYYCVLKPNHFKRIFSTRRSVSYLVCLWIFVAIFTWIPVIGGWAEMAFNPLMACCNWHFFLESAEMVFTALAVILFMVNSFTIIAFSYYHVSRCIRQHNDQVSSHHGLSVQEIHLTKTFFVLVLSFVVMWFPTFTAIFLFRVAIREAYPRLVGLAVPFLLQVNSAINPWIYGVMNPSFRKKFKKLFKWNSEIQVHCATSSPNTGDMEMYRLENGHE